jgi:hypothetical protein
MLEMDSKEFSVVTCCLVREMESSTNAEKLGQEQDIQYASSSMGDVSQPQRNTWQYLKHYFTSREGWIGDYVCVSCCTMNVY